MPYPGGRSQMSDEGKLFIGGLDGEVTDTMLEEHFSKYGTVTNVAVVKDRETGKSRGFGFVTFENPQDAKDAMAAMDGKEIEGRAIRVDEAGKPSGRSGVFRGGSHLRGNFFRGGRRGEGGGYSNRSYGDSGNDRGYGERSYSREGSYRGGRSYGDEDGGGFSRSFGSGGRGGGGGGYNAGYRDSRSQSSYGGEQRTSYRENYDGYG